MSERPNALLAGLFASGVLLAVLLVSLGGLAGCGSGLRALVIGALTGCTVFFHQFHYVPLGGLLLTALVLASLTASLRTLVGFVRAQRLLQRLPLERLEGGLGAVAREAGVDAYVLRTEGSAFCFGLLRPKVVLGVRLLERLDAEEQAAVVWHEAHHAQTREPLRAFVGRLVVQTFFWLPLLGDLLDRYVLVRELAADRRALEHTSTSALAGALYEVTGPPAMAGVGLDRAATARVDRLVDPKSSLPPLFGRRRVVTSMAALLALSAGVALPAEIDLGMLEPLHRLGAGAGPAISSIIAASVVGAAFAPAVRAQR